MKQIQSIKSKMTIESKMTYQEFEARFDKVVIGLADGFVETGYYLKYARDTNILTESPYRTMAEYAKAKYGMDKSMTSRFIAINDRFSEDGYSNKLKDKYVGFGYTKLALMLTLPDEIIQEISPSYSKAEIQAIKDEVDAERKISDLEVMMEGGPEQPSDGSTLLNMLIRQLGEDSPELYVQMAGIVDLEDMQEWTRKAKEILAPDAEKQYSIRISGIGRFLASIRESEDTVTVTALRTLEKTCYNYQALKNAWEEILPICPLDENWQEKDYQNAWEDTYNREFPGKAKVAPVQQSKKPEKTELKPATRKESKVQKAPKPATKKEETPVSTPAAPPEEPEKPESTGAETVGNEKDTNCVRLEETPQSTSTEEQLPGQIDIEEAIEEAEERNRNVSHIESDITQTAAGQESVLDKEWENEKEEFLDRLKRMNTEGSLLSRNLSQIPNVHIVVFREILINMAALIEKELLRRGEEF